MLSLSSLKNEWKNMYIASKINQKNLLNYSSENILAKLTWNSWWMPPLSTVAPTFKTNKELKSQVKVTEKGILKSTLLFENQLCTISCKLMFM